MSYNESVSRSAGMLSPKRFVSEAVAIFLGVAAALAGQAWFEERADRLVERDLLNNVQQGTVGYHYGHLEALGGPLPPSRFSDAGVELLSSRQFENIVRDKTLWLLEIEGSMDAHVRHSARVRELIEAYVGAR